MGGVGVVALAADGRNGWKKEMKRGLRCLWREGMCAVERCFHEVQCLVVGSESIARACG